MLRGLLKGLAPRLLPPGMPLQQEPAEGGPLAALMEALGSIVDAHDALLPLILQLQVRSTMGRGQGWCLCHIGCVAA